MNFTLESKIKLGVAAACVLVMVVAGYTGHAFIAVAAAAPLIIAAGWNLKKHKNDIKNFGSDHK